MLPTYEHLNAPKPLFRIPFGRISVAAVSLPLFGFLFCIIWSMYWDFERATATHCDVPNFLPSISSAIGNYQPQQTIWRLAICLHMPLRLAVAKMYQQYYRVTIRRNRRIYANIACSLNVVEDCALLALSLWTSADSYAIHRNAFIIFIVCSELYMVMSYFLNRNGRKMELLPIEQRSLNYKAFLFILNVLSFFLAGYFFLRHNNYCEPGAYSIFSYFEYWFASVIVCYRATSIIDLCHGYMVYTRQNGFTFHLKKRKTYHYGSD